MGEHQQVDAVDAELVEAVLRAARVRPGVDRARSSPCAADEHGVALADVAQRELPVGGPRDVVDHAASRRALREVADERDHQRGRGDPPHATAAPRRAQRSEPATVERRQQHDARARPVGHGAARARQPGEEGRDRRDPARGQPGERRRRTVASGGNSGASDAGDQPEHGGDAARRARRAGSRRRRRAAATGSSSSSTGWQASWAASGTASTRRAPRGSHRASTAASGRASSSRPPSRAPRARSRSCAPARGRRPAARRPRAHSTGMPRAGAPDAPARAARAPPSPRRAARSAPASPAPRTRRAPSARRTRRASRGSPSGRRRARAPAPTTIAQFAPETAVRWLSDCGLHRRRRASALDRDWCRRSRGRAAGRRRRRAGRLPRRGSRAAAASAAASSQGGGAPTLGVAAREHQERDVLARVGARERCRSAAACCRSARSRIASSPGRRTAAPASTATVAPATRADWAVAGERAVDGRPVTVDEQLDHAPGMRGLGRAPRRCARPTAQPPRSRPAPPRPAPARRARATSRRAAPRRAPRHRPTRPTAAATAQPDRRSHGDPRAEPRRRGDREQPQIGDRRPRGHRARQIASRRSTAHIVTRSSQPLEGLVADARHVSRSSTAVKRPFVVAPVQDALRHRRTDARQRLERRLRRRC